MIPLWVALISAIPPTLTSIVSLIFHLRNRKAITDIHLTMNGRMDQLVDAAKAQGRQMERDEQEKKKSNPTT
jgi:hypothetical protein